MLLAVRGIQGTEAEAGAGGMTIGEFNYTMIKEGQRIERELNETNRNGVLTPILSSRHSPRTPPPPFFCTCSPHLSPLSCTHFPSRLNCPPVLSFSSFLLVTPSFPLFSARFSLRAAARCLRAPLGRGAVRGY